jgi:hypothetical protein
MEMIKKSKVFLLIIISIYLGTYSYFSNNGEYRPKAYGIRIINGQHTIESKKFGAVWFPNFPKQSTLFYEVIYFPLIHLDRFLVHHEMRE